MLAASQKAVSGQCPDIVGRRRYELASGFVHSASQRDGHGVDLAARAERQTSSTLDFYADTSGYA
ncbi:hypothetical protein SBA4_6510001 [Candidatus Sulfopaludibacter sp. SbA4]|nr:hypothetical protein SBA4_6510001 [Candidatus Sulfopaludibacter sp. SbA4]